MPVMTLGSRLSYEQFTAAIIGCSGHLEYAMACMDQETDVVAAHCTFVHQAELRRTANNHTLQWAD